MSPAQRNQGSSGTSFLRDTPDTIEETSMLSKMERSVITVLCAVALTLWLSTGSAQAQCGSGTHPQGGGGQPPQGSAGPMQFGGGSMSCGMSAMSGGGMMSSG